MKKKAIHSSWTYKVSFTTIFLIVMRIFNDVKFVSVSVFLSLVIVVDAVVAVLIVRRVVVAGGCVGLVGDGDGVVIVGVVVVVVVEFVVEFTLVVAVVIVSATVEKNHCNYLFSEISSQF